MLDSQRAKSIFLEAVDRPIGDRAAYLDGACGDDPELRQRVEQLLQAHDRPDSLPEATPEAGPTLDCLKEAADGDLPLPFLAPSDEPGVLGRLGHYVVHEVIGRGGMGVVLRAFDEQLHRVVAIKVMAPQLATSATARKRFVREARAAAAVAHEHVVTIHAVEEAHGLPYLVMSYVAGVSLQERLDRSGPLPLREVLRIGMQAAQGLAAAHAQGLVHRDVKPANILLENGVERVKLTDFGLARAADDASLTHTGQVTGTPLYMSPEQAEGKAVDARSDLFSLGSVLYALCTGRPPFRAGSSMAILKRVCEETATPVRQVNPEVPDWLADVIAKLHAKDPAERFPSAAALAELLGQYLAYVQQPSVMPPVVEKAAPSPRPVGRRRWFAAAAVLAALMAGLGTTEATGVTRLRATMIRIFTPDGILVVEADDPAVKVTVEGENDLVITGSGPQEVRLKPGSYRVHAVKDGRQAKLDRDLVTIIRGEKHVVRVRVEGKPAAAVAAPAPVTPFVILGRSGRAEKQFSTLAEAMRLAWDGDTIEVRDNGPFALDPLLVKNQAIRIRAGAGFWPVLLLGRRDQPPAVSPKRFDHSPVVLEGLEFRARAASPTSRRALPVIACSDSPVYAANCRFVQVTNSYGDSLNAATSPYFLVCNCQFVGQLWSLTAFHSQRIVLRNNLVLSGAQGGTALIVVATHALNSNVELTRNTLVGKMAAMQLYFQHDPRAGVRKGLSIKGSRNILHGETLLRLHGPDVEDFRELFQRVADWKGDHNAWPTSSLLYGHRELIGTGLAEWKGFWHDPEPGSLEGRIRFLGVDLDEELSRSPEQLTPETFRLHPESVGHAAGPDGEDLGADVDLVGPGPAYERWKKTPGYQDWLKISGQRP